VSIANITIGSHVKCSCQVGIEQQAASSKQQAASSKQQENVAAHDRELTRIRSKYGPSCLRSWASSFAFAVSPPALLWDSGLISSPEYWNLILEFLIS
jgi:hypothetical protein